MFRCNVCNRLSESIDEAPCITDHEYSPKEIVTLHYLIRENGQVKVFCSGKPVGGAVKGLYQKHYVNCIRCRKKIKEELLTNKKQETSEPITDENNN